MSAAAVEARGLTRRFGQFTAVDHVNFAVPPGEIFGFLGANGAGKTTVIRMLCGLLSPSEGEGQVAGFDIHTQPESIRRVIGYMSQRFSLYDDLTVGENLRFFGGVYGLDRKTLRARCAELMGQLDLAGEERRVTRELPLGFKQRLALGCAIAHRPRILFLDEPTGGVDPVVRRHFWDLIYGLAAGGTTVFVTTHYMDEAEYCHRISIMYQGRIVALDSPRNLKAEYRLPSVQDVFIHLVDR